MNHTGIILYTKLLKMTSASFISSKVESQKHCISLNTKGWHSQDQFSQIQVLHNNKIMLSNFIILEDLLIGNYHEHPLPSPKNCIFTNYDNLKKKHGRLFIY